MSFTTDFWPFIGRCKAVVSKFVVCFLAFGIYKSFGVLLPYLVDEYHTDVAHVACGYGMFGGLIYISGPISGALTNIYGERPVVVIGGLLAAIGIIACAFTTSILQLSLALICSGIGHGLAMLATIKPISIIFRDSFALANGIALGGASFGMMVMPPLADMLIERYGWRNTFLLFGALDLHIIVAGFLIRSSEYRDHCDDDEESVVLLGKENHRRLKNILNTLWESMDIYIFRWQPMVIFYDILIFSIVFSVWTVYLIPHAQQRGINDQDATFLSTIAGVTNFVGRVVNAPLIDYGWSDSRTLFVVVSLINAVLFLADPLFTSYTLMSISAAIAGLSIGAGNSIWSVMIKQFVNECGASSSFVETIGWTTLFSGVGNIIAPPVSGVIFSASRDYDMCFRLIGILSVVIFVALTTERLIVTRRRIIPRVQKYN